MIPYGSSTLLSYNVTKKMIENIDTSLIITFESRSSIIKSESKTILELNIPSFAMRYFTSAK